MPGEAVQDAEVIVVVEHATPTEAWVGVRDALADLGYRRGVTLGHVTYLLRRPWDPVVAVRDSGTLRVRGHAFTPLLPVATTLRFSDDPADRGRPPQREGAGPGVTGVLGSPRAARTDEARVIDAVWTPLREYRDAIAWEALGAREAAIERSLYDVWLVGHAPDGTWRGTEAARRRCIGAMWLHTADTYEGGVVRARIARFIDREIQPFAPYAADEIAWVQSRRAFDEEFTPMAP